MIDDQHLNIRTRIKQGENKLPTTIALLDCGATANFIDLE